MRPVLTERQQEFFEYLETGIKRDGVVPSLRQAAVDFGVSHTAVAQLVQALEDKGYVRRQGRYSRTIHLLNRSGQPAAGQRWREVPVIGRITAGLPMYAQQDWDGTMVLDSDVFKGQNLFALRVQGDSMRDAGILPDDLVICEPRQYARDGEIVVALIHDEEATVKYFFLRPDGIELRAANEAYAPQHYEFGAVLIQGKVIGVQRMLG